MSEYKDCKIENIRRNKKTGLLHANLVSSTGEILISATLDYIADALEKNVPHESVPIVDLKK